MARWHEARVKLFEDFSSNLELYEPHNKGLFKCPICLEAFTPDFLVSRPKQNSLSVAHVVPKSFLNAGYTLCCIRCDGKFGSTLAASERVLRHNLRTAKWNGRKFMARTNFEHESGGFTVFTEIDWNDKGEPVPTFRQSDIPKGVCEQELERQCLSFVTRDKSGKPDDFTLWKPYFYSRRVKYANLNWWHSLYLFMFHHFGYQWVFEDPRGQLVRKQLLNLDEDIIPSFLLEPKVLPLVAPYEAPPHDHLPVRPSLRFGLDASGKLIESGYYMVFPKLHDSMDSVTLFLPWDFETCLERPVPVAFTERLRYGHIILKYRIPDPITQSDMVKYAREETCLTSTTS